jgi:hypothetical protein
MKRSAIILSLVALFAMAGSASAQVPYSVINSAYSQSFDSLPATGSVNAWTNNVTLLGWYAYNSLPGNTGTSGVRDPLGTAGIWNTTTNIRAGDGTSNAGALWSFGTGTDAERALGSIGSGTPGDFSYAVVLQNTTGFILDSFTLSYTGEQWRNGGNTTQQRLQFDYAVFAGLPTNADLQGINTTGYTLDSNLDFLGPIATATAGALDGNLPANQANPSDTVALTWGINEYLVLRWWDDNDVGNDHGLAIDNLTFRATPEPATLALLGLGGLLVARRRR